jgi:3-oxoacyl-ACP reductase-like protein
MKIFKNFKLIKNFIKSINPIYYKYFCFLASLALLKKYFNGPKNFIRRSLENQIAIITGASAGLGKETAKDLLKNGATVIFACRNEAKTLAVIKSITDKDTIKNAHYMNLNLSSFNSVEKFVNEFSKKFDKLDLLINNP